MKIALDTFGGDNAPNSTIEGAQLAIEINLKQGFDDLEITLFGNKELINKHIKGTLSHRINIEDIIDCPEDDEEDPYSSGENPESAIRTALRRHRKGQFDAVVSAGPTGTQVVASLLELEKCKGITRLAIGSRIPTVKGFSFLLDVGANLVASPHQLVQFAALGHVYVEQIFEKKSPSIGVLNVGKERKIGDRSVITANALLKESHFNYIGFVEGRDIPLGLADIVVTNGFLGNVLLKYTEGLPSLLKKILDIQEDTHDAILIKKQLDFESFGGEPLLGLKGVSIICHGASSSNAIASALIRTRKIVNKQLHKKTEVFLTDHFDDEFKKVTDLRSFRKSLREISRIKKHI